MNSYIVACNIAPRCTSIATLAYVGKVSDPIAIERIHRNYASEIENHFTLWIIRDEAQWVVSREDVLVVNTSVSGN